MSFGSLRSLVLGKLRIPSRCQPAVGVGASAVSAALAGIWYLKHNAGEQAAELAEEEARKKEAVAMKAQQHADNEVEARKKEAPTNNDEEAEKKEATMKAQHADDEEAKKEAN